LDARAEELEQERLKMMQMMQENEMWRREMQEQTRKELEEEQRR